MTTSRALRPAIAVIVAAALIGLRVLEDGIGLSSLVVAGTDFVDRGLAPEELIIKAEGTGYDGQFYYRLSLDPFTSKQTDYGITLDEPGYRQQRIGFPLLAFLLANVTGLSTLILLPILGLVGIALATAAAERLLREAGANPWWAVAVGLAPGVLVSARLDLAEPLALGLALAGLAMWPRYSILAALLLTLAVLTRETTLLIAAGVGVAAAVRVVETWPSGGSLQWRHFGQVALATIPLVIYVAWQAWLSVNWTGASTGSSPTERLAPPLSGLVDALARVHYGIDVEPVVEWGWWLLRVSLVAFILSALLFIRRSTIRAEIKYSYVFSLLLMTILAGLSTSQQSTRALLEPTILALLIIAATRSRRAQLVGMLVPALAVLAFTLTP